MKFSWEAVKKAVLDFWSKLSRPQKIITVAAPLLVASLLTALIIWASTPTYVTLFSKLSDAEAGTITAKLTELKIPYRLADNGSAILVKQQDAASTRLTLANAGLPLESKFSFDYLNTTRLGEPDSDRRIRYQLALQVELETTLRALNGVQEARVHIVQPEQTLFSEDSKPTTAGITLTLEPGTTFQEETIQGIANLLAGSIEGLTVENVTIIDSAGNILSDILDNKNSPIKLSSTQFQMQQTIETTMQKKVESMLNRVLGFNSTVVRVNVELDFDQIKVVQSTYGPGAIVSRQETNEETTSDATGAVPGTTTNIPGYDVITGGTNSSSAKTSVTENWNNDNTQREQVVSPGAIKRLSVSVLVDSDNAAVRQTTDEQIEAIVASAAGIDETRGDNVQVAAMPFNKTEQQQIERARAEAEARQKMINYALIGIGVLAVLLFLLIRRWRKKRVDQMRLEQEADALNQQTTQEFLLAQAEAEAEAQARIEQKQKKSADEIERQKIKDAVNQYVRNNPDDVANLVKTWMTEDK